MTNHLSEADKEREEQDEADKTHMHESAAKQRESGSAWLRRDSEKKTDPGRQPGVSSNTNHQNVLPPPPTCHTSHTAPPSRQCTGACPPHQSCHNCAPAAAAPLGRARALGPPPARWGCQKSRRPRRRRRPSRES